MGLLDDAIREHLELKRLRGADPADVLRQEREVLGADEVPQPRSELLDPEHWSEDAERIFGEPAPDVELAEAPGLDQETAEVDMREVLDLDAPRPDAPRSSGVQVEPPPVDDDWPASAAS